MEKTSRMSMSNKLYIIGQALNRINDFKRRGCNATSKTMELCDEIISATGELKRIIQKGDKK